MAFDQRSSHTGRAEVRSRLNSEEPVDEVFEYPWPKRISNKISFKNEKLK